LPALKQRIHVSVPEDGQLTVPFHVHPDQRRVIVAATMDPAIAQLLTNSRLGTQDLVTWLADARWRASRKACLLNLTAKLRSLPHDQSLKPLINEVVNIFAVGAERVYARVTPGFHEDLQALARDARHPFYYEGPPTAPIHRRLLDAAQDAMQMPVTSLTHSLESYRQGGRTCMQAGIAVPKAADGAYFADLDIDLGNPLQDVAGFVTHIIELGGGPTDHLDLRALLDKDKHAQPFLGYAVV